MGCWILISKYKDGHVALSFHLVGKTDRFGKTRNRSTNLYSTTNEVTIDSTTSTTEEAIRLGKEKLAGYFKFPLDDWQLEAGGSILMGYNVVVCAPTGSGKRKVYWWLYTCFLFWTDDWNIHFCIFFRFAWPDFSLEAHHTKDQAYDIVII